MSFFKDFKEDFSAAVNELLPTDDGLDTDEALEENLEENDEEILINTLDSVDLQEELDKMSEEPKEDAASSLFNVEDEEPEVQIDTLEEEPLSSFKEILEDNSEEVKEIPIEVATAAVVAEDNSPETSVWEEIKEESKEEKETKKEESLFRKETPRKVDFGSMLNEEAVSDQEVSTITKGMTINGDIESTGSLNIDGKVNGNVTSKGKVVVTGNLTGNTNAVEFFADSARVKGEINATGKVKVGDGSVIVGNITATSAVIAGAVKGDIDVHGPVIVDTTAVIMGNIKSQSVQINNGAAIEGFCSQVYADVKYDDLFGDAE